ncbi:MAG TPA: hypothetical protein VIL46_02340 [Gemmataceae bacterium]
MPERNPSEQLSEKDRLVTRPDEELPTPLDPASPEARGYPADPKRVPREGQGDPDATDPAPGDIDRSV